MKNQLLKCTKSTIHFLICGFFMAIMLGENGFAQQKEAIAAEQLSDSSSDVQQDRSKRNQPSMEEETSGSNSNVKFTLQPISMIIGFTDIEGELRIGPQMAFGLALISGSFEGFSLSAQMPFGRFYFEPSDRSGYFKIGRAQATFSYSDYYTDYTGTAQGWMLAGGYQFKFGTSFIMEVGYELLTGLEIETSDGNTDSSDVQNSFGGATIRLGTLF